VAQQFYATIAGDHPLSSSPSYARSGTAAHRDVHNSLRVIANALGYALVWAADHEQIGPYPYGYRVQRRLARRLSAALKLAA
jgi:hypothetical protein